MLDASQAECQGLGNVAEDLFWDAAEAKARREDVAGPARHRFVGLAYSLGLVCAQASLSDRWGLVRQHSYRQIIRQVGIGVAVEDLIALLQPERHLFRRVA